MSWPTIRKGVAAAVGIFFLMSAAVVAWRRWDRHQLDQTELVGQQLVEALERYHKEHHHYPASLQLLVPRYLAAVRPPLRGLHRWEYYAYQYSLATPQGRQLSVPIPATDSLRRFFELSAPENAQHYPILYYNSESAQWIYDN